jgi:hypothetical protein
MNYKIVIIREAVQILHVLRLQINRTYVRKIFIKILQKRNVFTLKKISNFQARSLKNKNNYKWVTPDQVSQFTYLGCSTSYQVSNDAELKLAKSLQLISTIKRTIFRKVRTETILKLYNTLVLPTFLYGSENWTLTASQRRRIEMFSPSMYSPSRTLHYSMRIFRCWKQCCRSSSDSLFTISVAFPLLRLRTSNLVPFNADLFLRTKKKTHVARTGEYGGCFNTVILCFVKNLLTDRVLCAGAYSWWRIHELFIHISVLSSQIVVYVRLS